MVSWKQNKEIVQLLLENKADANVKNDDGQTALMEGKKNNLNLIIKEITF